MDTHTAYKKLVNSGMPEKQAESIVEIQANSFYHYVATKDELQNLKIEIMELKSEMKAAFAKLRADLRK